MKRIENNFDIIFSDEKSPYFQAEEIKRLVFPFKMLRGNSTFLNQLISFLFDDPTRIDLTFFNSYKSENSSKPRYFIRHSLHKTFYIKNWKEQLVCKPDSREVMSFITLKDITVTEIKRYIRALLKGKRASYIGFYNDQYLLLVDGEEVVIIAKHIEDLEKIKKYVQEIRD